MEPLTCVHVVEVTKEILRCRLLNKRGVPVAAGYGNGNYPCVKCRQYWQGDNSPEELPEAVSKLFPSVTPTKPAGVGLGDVVHGITSALGIPECGGCADRREWLNKFRLGG